LQNSNGFRENSTFILAGWVLADLLLALSMIFLAADVKSPKIIPTVSPTVLLQTQIVPIVFPPLTPTFTIIPTGTFTGPIGLGDAHCYNIYPSSGAIDSDFVTQALKGQLPNTQTVRAGLVLIWSHGSTVSEGVEMSRQVGRIVRQNFQLSFADSKMKSLSFSMGSENLVQLEIYFYTDSSWESGHEVPCSYNQ